MTTSTFFNNFGQVSEQELLEDLVVESIRIYGQDMYYLSRKRNNFDGVYYDDDVSTFETAYLIEFYIKNVEGFEGQGSFLSKFGLEIRDQATLTVATRTFSNDITRHDSDIIRPREGDLIYIPLTKRTFEIKFVEKRPFFYQFGSLQMFDMMVELYEYSNERFTTGIDEIDSIQTNHSFNAYDYGILSQDGYILKSEDDRLIMDEEYQANLDKYDPGRDNERIDSEISSDDVIDWSEFNPFAESNY